MCGDVCVWWCLLCVVMMMMRRMFWEGYERRGKREFLLCIWERNHVAAKTLVYAHTCTHIPPPPPPSPTHSSSPLLLLLPTSTRSHFSTSTPHTQSLAVGPDGSIYTAGQDRRIKRYAPRFDGCIHQPVSPRVVREPNHKAMDRLEAAVSDGWGGGRGYMWLYIVG